MTLDIADDREDIETIFTSWEGIIFTTVSASISTAASILIISLILRSKKGLAGSVYHRIIFGMSVADLLQSVPMALTTLPMPSDMIYGGYESLILGNNTSCNIQGFSVLLGGMSNIVYNASLSVYYLCSIGYDMIDDDFRSHIEPSLHIASIIPSLILAGITTASGEIHPDPRAATWCQNVKYPWWCKGEECIGAEYEDYTKVDYIAIIIAVVSLFSIIASMAVIALKVYREENSLENTKIITAQAIAYSCINILYFVIAVVLPIVMVESENGEEAPPSWLCVTFLVLRPIQGLFNAVIFVYHRAYGLRRRYRNLIFSSAIMWALEGGEEDDQVISDMKIVRLDSNIRYHGNFEVEQESEDGDDVDTRSGILEASNTMSNEEQTPYPTEVTTLQDLSGFSQTSFGTF